MVEIANDEFLADLKYFGIMRYLLDDDLIVDVVMLSPVVEFSLLESFAIRSFDESTLGVIFTQRSDSLRI